MFCRKLTNRKIVVLSLTTFMLLSQYQANARYMTSCQIDAFEFMQCQKAGECCHENVQCYSGCCNQQTSRCINLHQKFSSQKNGQMLKEKQKNQCMSRDRMMQGKKSIVEEEYDQDLTDDEQNEQDLINDILIDPFDQNEKDDLWFFSTSLEEPIKEQLDWYKEYAQQVIEPPKNLLQEYYEDMWAEYDVLENDEIFKNKDLNFEQVDQSEEIWENTKEIDESEEGKPYNSKEWREEWDKKHIESFAQWLQAKHDYEMTQDLSKEKYMKFQQEWKRHNLTSWEEYERAKQLKQQNKRFKQLEAHEKEKKEHFFDQGKDIPFDEKTWKAKTLSEEQNDWQTQKKINSLNGGKKKSLNKKNSNLIITHKTGGLNCPLMKEENQKTDDLMLQFALLAILGMFVCCWLGYCLAQKQNNEDKKPESKQKQSKSSLKKKAVSFQSNNGSIQIVQTENPITIEALDTVEAGEQLQFEGEQQIHTGRGMLQSSTPTNQQISLKKSKLIEELEGDL